MRITILVTGKTKDACLQKLTEEYLDRLQHYVKIDFQVLPELKNTKNLPIALQKEKEGEIILKTVELTDELVLLDERGTEYTSVGFAGLLKNRMNGSTKRMIFAVGGPFGFSPAVYLRANLQISLSKMTFSHQMIRVFLAEQMYRAMTIIRGEQYHNE